MRLFEKYRPKTLAEIVGQDKAVKAADRLIKAGIGGKAFWISGVSGSGKTTLARILAAEVADDFYVTEFDSGNSLRTAELEEVCRTMCIYGGGKKSGRAYIINEAHCLSKQMIQELLGVLERIPNHCVFIFTTTVEGQEGLFENQIDAGPLLSRCIELPLTVHGLDHAFGARCKEIAIAEGLDGMPLSEYNKLARDCRNNFRKMLQEIEKGVMCQLVSDK